MTKVFQNYLFYLFRGLLRVEFCLENNVAALYISTNLLEAIFLKRGPQLRHFNNLMAADINTSQYADKGLHA